MSSKKSIPISKPVTGNDEWESLKDPIMSGWLTSGPKVKSFEKLSQKASSKICNCSY